MQISMHVFLNPAIPVLGIHPLDINSENFAKKYG